MRIVSWTVVIGSVSAILYGGIRPLVQDMRLPEVNPAQVSGTMVRTPANTTKACTAATQKDNEQRETGSTTAPEDCDEPRLANQ